MPLPLIANTVRTAVEGSCQGGGQWVNVLHFRHTGGAPSAADIAALDTQVSKLYAGPAYAVAGAHQVLYFANSATTLDKITYTPLDGTSASTIASHGGTGTDAAATMAPEVAAVLSLRTAFRGRSYRGRVYLPPYTINQTASGKIGAGVLTAINAQASGFMAALAAASWEWVVASYLNSLATSVSSVYMDTLWDVQRRRKV